MKRLRPEFIIIALSAALFAWGCFAPSAFAADCLPVEAGGYGAQYTRVVHADHKVVIRTFTCNGQGAWVFEKYEGDQAPAEPATAKDLAALLQRLRPKAAEMRNRLVYEDLAREQLRLYQPPPAQVFKQRGKVRNV